jgi:hypothetical protein
MRHLTCFIGLVAVAVIACCFVQVSRLSHTCIACRLTRVDATCFGLTRSTYYENDCSRWYPTHVEPVHAHIWERGTCERITNGLGMPVGFACSPGHYPIRLLDPTTQLRVYQHFRNPLEAKRLFESLADEKSHDDRLDELDDDRGHFTVDAIQNWEAEGFPDTWVESCSRYYAKLVEERKKSMAELHAGSEMKSPVGENKGKKDD